MKPHAFSKGLFDTLALPRAMEIYRRMVVHQIHTKCPTIMFRSVCWASTEIGNNPLNQSEVVVLPGEEEYMLKVHGISFEPLHPQALSCPHKRVETEINDRKLKAALATPKGAVAELPTVTSHKCTASPTERPILCRTFPFGIRRDPKNPRRAIIVAEARGWEYVRGKLSGTAINQMLHNVANIFVPMWDFLGDAWWDYYLNAYNPAYDWQPITDFTFTINSDVIRSTIAGAPDEMKAELLAEMAQPACPACEGKGIEFWDSIIHPVTRTRQMLPEHLRRFDLCRTCVLPHLGMLHTHSGLIINPHNRKILAADGKSYRGDKA